MDLVHNVSITFAFGNIRYVMNVMALCGFCTVKSFVIEMKFVWGVKLVNFTWSLRLVGAFYENWYSTSKGT